jgi:hypothetical protein
MLKHLRIAVTALSLTQYGRGTPSQITLRYWMLTLTIGGLAAAPWLRWRFTLRTLLIATTLFAVGMGVVAVPGSN